MAIPKHIFSGLPSLETIPDEFAKNFRIIQDLNPNFSFKLFSNEMQSAFIAENYDRHVYENYLLIDESYGAARNDLFRLLLLFRLGGVWLDSKTTMKRSLETFIDETDTLILSHWTKWSPTNPHLWGSRSRLLGPEIVTWFICVEPANNLIGKAITEIQRHLREYSPARNGIGKHAALVTTGPIAFTNAITPLLNPSNHRMIDSYSFGIRYSIFDSWEGHVALIPNNYRISRKPLVKVERDCHVAIYIASVRGILQAQHLRVRKVLEIASNIKTFLAPNTRKRRH